MDTKFRNSENSKTSEPHDLILNITDKLHLRTREKSMGITKPCTHLHPPPSTSTHLHPAPCISTKLISTSTQLRPRPPNSFQPARSSLQHPQSYKNQNIARNWGISPNLGKKFQNCLFFLKIGTHGILEELILHPDLVFQNPTPKSIFGQIWFEEVKILHFA